MSKRIIRDRRLTDDEAGRYQRLREQIAAELPDIRRQAKEAKPRIMLKEAVGQDDIRPT